MNKKSILAGKLATGLIATVSVISCNNQGNGDKVRENVTDTTVKIDKTKDSTCGDKKMNTTTTKMKDSICGDKKMNTANPKAMDAKTKSSKTKESKCGEGKCGDKK